MGKIQSRLSFMKSNPERVLVVSICMRVKGHSLQTPESGNPSGAAVKVKPLFPSVCFLSYSNEKLVEIVLKVP